MFSIIAFIAIGIPVIHREYNNKTAFYLDQTLKSLINPLTKKDKEDLQIILFLVDESKEKRQSIFTKIINLFEKDSEAGLMTVVGIPKRYYLRLEHLPPTYKNSPDRMYWRSKQALDYAYIFNYASSLCKYFMQLEDDVIASPNYLNVILKDIQDLNSRQNREIGQSRWDEKPIHPQPWLTKIYYRMGFIGRVIPSHFLPFFSTWIRVYYAHFPVDLEITYLFQTYKNYKEEEITAELFTHIGAQSSSLGT